MAYKGKVAVHGANGLVAWTGAATATLMVNGAEVTDEFQVDKLKDSDGNVVGAHATGRTRKCVFDVIPYDAGGVLATAKTNIKFPDPLAAITASSFGIASIDGTWNYVGPAVTSYTQEGYVKLRLPCEQYDQTGSATPSALT